MDILPICGRREEEGKKAAPRWGKKRLNRKWKKHTVTLFPVAGKQKNPRHGDKSWSICDVKKELYGSPECEAIQGGKVEVRWSTKSGDTSPLGGMVYLVCTIHQTLSPRGIFTEQNVAKTLMSRLPNAIMAGLYKSNQHYEVYGYVWNICWESIYSWS